MKKISIYVLVLALLLPATASAQRDRSYVIGFYNLENLFDTYQTCHTLYAEGTILSVHVRLREDLLQTLPLLKTCPPGYP